MLIGTMQFLGDNDFIDIEDGECTDNITYIILNSNIYINSIINENTRDEVIK